MSASPFFVFPLRYLMSGAAERDAYNGPQANLTVI